MNLMLPRRYLRGALVSLVVLGAGCLQQPDVRQPLEVKGSKEAATTERELEATVGPTYELKAPPEASYTETHRPQFHFSPASGWIGDPDGMIRYNDVYHVFWWGHAESKDLVHWNERPYPMVGDDGSFVYYSGSVVADKRNTSGFARGDQPPMVAIYTMHDKATGEETQALSVSQDYTAFVFYDGNPVLDAEQAAFRDPQVFYHKETDRWVMVIALPEDRKVSFYASRDLKQWEHLSDFGPVGARSQVWEVPDLFELPVDGDASRTKWVLLCGMGPNRAQYFIGDFDGTEFRLDPAANRYLLEGEGLPGTVFADFEDGLPDGWIVDGDEVAVGRGEDLGFYKVSGYLGAGFLSTYTPGSPSGNRSTVTVTSPSFDIQKSAINLLVSGGDHFDKTRVNLVIDGEIVRSAAGDNSVQMRWVGWDVSEFKGATAQIQVVDAYTAGDVGHINVDHIIFSDVLMETGREHANWLDFGPDYYAVRTYRDYDEVENRTVTMAWMGNWEYARDVPTSWGRGALALPRELELRSYAGGLRILQTPIPLLEELRQDVVELSGLEVEGIRPLSEFQPPYNTYEIDVTFQITDPQARLGLRLAVSEDGYVAVGYDAGRSNVFIDRTHPENGQFSGHFPKYARAPLEASGGMIRLRVFVDQSSVEVFADDGEVTMTALMFPDPDSTGIELFSDSGRATVTDLRAWRLTSIWHGMSDK